MIKQVTTLNASTAATVLTPSLYCHQATIQNNGSGVVRLSFDGGAAYTDYLTNQTGTNPTTSTGYKLAAGAYVAMTFIAGKSPPPIVGIMESATTTLDITTDDTKST